MEITLGQIAAMIAAIAFLILVAFLVPTVVQLRQTVKQLEDTTGKLDKSLPGIMTNMEDISENLSAILKTGRKQVDVVNDAVANLKGIVDDVVFFEKQIKRKVESPIFQSASTIAATAKAVQAFLNVMGGKRNGTKETEKTPH